MTALERLDAVIAEAQAHLDRGGNHKGWWPIPQIVDLDELQHMLAELRAVRDRMYALENHAQAIQEALNSGDGTYRP